MDSVYVVREPKDCDRLSDSRSRSPTFLAALRSPPGRRRSTRSGAGTSTGTPKLLLSMAEVPESEVASRLHIVGGGMTLLLSKDALRRCMESNDWCVSEDRSSPRIRNVPPLTGGCLIRRRGHRQ